VSKASYISVVLLSFVACATQNSVTEKSVCDANDRAGCDPNYTPAPKETAAPTVEDAPKVISKCPDGMVYIEGDYCPVLEEICLKWGDPDNKGANGPAQCLEFKYPTKCLSKRIKMSYCIDLYPLPNVPSELPTTNMTWYDVKDACEKQGKRLCSRPEFTQACRGIEDHPYPYGNGYQRDCTACNCDRVPWVNPATHPFSDVDKRVPLGSMPRCKSDYGVFDMVGNNDRFVYNETERPFKSALMGGHAVAGARNRCTPSTTAHNESFKYYETGGLCCSNSK
jgi:sulfatase modifying factor 1